MKVLVTGAGGFLGRNLCVRLRETGQHEVIPVTRETGAAELMLAAQQADAVAHLAGVNRAATASEFHEGNDQFTARLCEALTLAGRAIPVICSSTIQVEGHSPYATSKREAEVHLERYSGETGAPVGIFRLPNVFGKWSRPNYNSVVATFCYNIARDLPISIHDPASVIRMVHVDDVIDAWLAWLASPPAGVSWPTVSPEYEITVGDLADRIREFRAVRDNHTIGEVGTGLSRALYSTYVSYLAPSEFAYPLKRNEDPRGVFVEMLRTTQAGQFSFFTAHPGVTRGGHYHHTKTEKFLVLKGRARFRFHDLNTGLDHTIDTTGDVPMVVETIPGYAHDISNIGDEEMIVMLWANELFDRQRPDTIASKLDS